MSVARSTGARSTGARSSAGGRQSPANLTSNPPSQDPSTPTSTEPQREIIPPLDERRDQDIAIRLRHLRLTGEKYQQPYDLVKRPGFVTIGKPIAVDVNAFKVLSWPSITVYQYDVSILDHIP